MAIISQEAICQNHINKVFKNKNKLDSLLGQAKGSLNNLTSSVNDMADKALSPLDDVSNAIDNINNEFDNISQTLDNMKFDDDAQTIADCLGISTSISVDLPDLLPNPGKNLRAMLDSKINDVLSLFDNALDPSEKLIGESISAIENMIPVELLDTLLNFIQCLADCPGAEGLPTQVEIEAKLSEAGLDINRNIDFDSTGLSSKLTTAPSLDVKNHYKNIGGMLNNVKSKSKDILKNSPF